jgi:hypothetical protein
MSKRRWNITPARKFLIRTHLALRDGRHLAERDEYVLSRRGNSKIHDPLVDGYCPQLKL